MSQDHLVVRGAREHNLQNVSVTIPRDRLTVITGLSGSGKSSLVFDDLKKQGFIRVRVDGETYEIDKVPTLVRRQNHDVAVVVDRLVVKVADRTRLVDSLETALRAADGIVEVVKHAGPKGEGIIFSEKFGCPTCGLSLPELEPRQFSFNSPF